MPRPVLYKGCLCCRIGASGIVGKYFVEKSLSPQRTINLVRAYVMEKHIPPILPVGTRSLQERKSAQNVCSYKLCRAVYASVYMRFRCKD